MADQTLRSGLWPSLFWITSTASAGVGLDASGEKVGHVFYVEKAGNVRKIHFRTVTVNTGDTIKASLQNVDTSTGFPDETVDQSGTVVVASSDDNTWKSVTLGADRTVAEGDLLSVVFEFDSYVAGNMFICNAITDSKMGLGLGYVCHKTGGSWAKVSSRKPMVVLEYDDGTVGEILGAFAGFTETPSYSTSTDPKEIGLRFRLPFDTKLEGIQFHGRLSGNVLAAFYDDTPSEVATTVTYDADLTRSTSTDYTWMLLFATSQTIAANTWYRVTLRPTTTTSFRIGTQTFSAAAHRGQVVGGLDFEWTEKSAADVWSTSQLKRAAISLILDTLEYGPSSLPVFNRPIRFMRRR